ncbi:MAG: hypothetical protein ACRECQ_13915 [Burkholderiaceae bacterium]
MLPISGNRAAIKRSINRIAPPLRSGMSIITVLGGSAVVVRGLIVSSAPDTLNELFRLRLDRSFGFFLPIIDPMSSAI